MRDRINLGLQNRDNNNTYFCIIRDVSKQKNKEQDLLTAKEDAERIISTKSQFFANVSHEIRIPVQTIIGMMELLGKTSLNNIFL